jgi:hypothetical protein
METTAGETSETNSRDNLYRFTTERFNQAKSAGVFDHPELMSLIHGIVMQQPKQTACCVHMTNLLSRRLRSTLQGHFLVYGRRPVEVDPHNQPTADVLVVTGQKADCQDRHPSPEDVALLVEVADTTAAYDLGEKAVLYAQAGIGDYWVVLVNEDAIVQHRGPSAEGYHQVTRLAGSDTISPLAMPESIWTINALLGHEE